MHIRFERTVLLTVAVVLFLLDFVFLLARNALEQTVPPGENLVHSLLLGAALIATAFGFFSDSASAELTAVQRLGRLVLLAGILLAFYLVCEIAGLIRFEARNGTLHPQGTSTVVFSILHAVGTAVLCIVMFRLMTQLLFVRRKRGTRRNYLFMVVAIVLYTIARHAVYRLSDSQAHDNILTIILFVVVLVSMLVNAFRLPWILDLTRKEKLAMLGLTVLGGILFVVIAVNYELYRPPLAYIHPILHDLAILMFVFGAIYTGIGFASVLLHLPTAREFDRKRDEISSFHTMGRLMTQVFDRQELIETATQLAIHTGNADGGWIELCHPHGPLETENVQDDPSREAAREMYTKNIDASYLRSLTMKDGFSLRQLVLQSGKPAIVHDSSRDRRLQSASSPFASIALMPLNAHRATIGLLGLVKRTPYEFEKEAQNALAGFADLAAVALENSRLITESLERERFKQELAVARTMQSSLLPALLPLAPTYDIAARSLPAYEVGGDYFDVVRLDEERLGIIVGDVSGKGVPAALYMAQVKGIFQSLSRDGAATRDLLIRMNETLCESMDRKSFISILYAVLNIRTGMLTFSRAGHCPLLYISGGSPRYMRPNGMGLGLDPSDRFAETIEQETLILGKDDVIVLYTDGVTEARNASGEEFHYERLSDVVRDNGADTAETITASVIEAVKRHAGAGEADDDMTILVLRWKGAEEKGHQ